MKVHLTLLKLRSLSSAHKWFFLLTLLYSPCLLCSLKNIFTKNFYQIDSNHSLVDSFFRISTLRGQMSTCLGYLNDAILRKV